jgi:hypothetical protein
MHGMTVERRRGAEAPKRSRIPPDEANLASLHDPSCLSLRYRYQLELLVLQQSGEPVVFW